MDSYPKTLQRLAFECIKCHSHRCACFTCLQAHPKSLVLAVFQIDELTWFVNELPETYLKRPVSLERI